MYDKDERSVSNVEVYLRFILLKQGNFDNLFGKIGKKPINFQ